MPPHGNEPRTVNNNMYGGVGGAGGAANGQGGGGGTGEGPRLNNEVTTEHFRMNNYTGMFSGARDFTVTANINNNYLQPTPPPGPLPQFKPTRTRQGLTIDIEEIWKLQKPRSIPISDPFATVKLGSIMFCPQGGEPAEVAFYPDVDPEIGPWVAGVAGGEKMAKGWTRFNASDACNRTLLLRRHIPNLYLWLYQATFVFSRLRVSSNFEDYVLLHTIDFKIETYGAKQKPTEGFLFLCPEEDFQVEEDFQIKFRWPEFPAYWSRDPNGVERLSMDDATRLGFPPLEFKSRIQGSSFDSRVYDGLRQYQEEEQFDPDTPEYSIRMAGADLPLFQLSD
ncbi:hypothetical protein B0H16DRAFT_201488 [Mycena metata]|uniref:Uncharacterized protein n=1 Tax=Mycena metata TaxID=1033252 RepID=A0AAD7MTP3_9AGAR|nr:hypothetical protein B0H16DRAFT_201488 [Mycena metata]